jgi:transcriptional regulator with XRE-family HTH domain
MDPNHAPTPEDYPTWLNERVAAELKARRLALGLSAYALAVPRKLTDETILNIENCKHSPSLRTLGLLCQRLGTTVDVVIVAAVRRD